MLEDRTTAGVTLSDTIDDDHVSIDLVMALPPGGVLVGEPIARDRDVPIDIIASHPLRTLQDPEIEFGAISTDGSLWIETDTVEEERISKAQIYQARDRSLATARHKLEKYRNRERAVLDGKDVLIVGDGTESVSSIMSCAGQLLKSKAGDVSIAVPVIPPGAADTFESVAENVIALIEGSRPAAQYYDSLPLVSDNDVARRFERAAPSQA